VFAGNVGKDLLIDPLVNRMLGTGLSNQPLAQDVKDGTPASGSDPMRPGLYSLVGQLSNCGGSCAADRTRVVAKATCAAVLGSGAVLVN
jgi:hypothetical protein